MYYVYYAGSWVLWSLYQVSNFWTNVYEKGYKFCEDKLPEGSRAHPPTRFKTFDSLGNIVGFKFND